MTVAADAANNNVSRISNLPMTEPRLWLDVSDFRKIMFKEALQTSEVDCGVHFFMRDGPGMEWK